MSDEPTDADALEATAPGQPRELPAEPTAPAGADDTAVAPLADADTLAASDAPPRATSLDDRLLAARTRAKVFGGAAEAVRIGRYTILDRLGAGGMGTVFAAHDDELDRKVALKVLHAQQSEQARLLREAQALARLNHPHVVTVHEIGSADGNVFVAMELVQGGTLRAWTEAEERTWSEILAVLLQAAHGLAAAHRAGLVHRDFKPDNVMVGEDPERGPQARVVDFGLARPLGVDDETDETDKADNAPLLGALRTVTGAMLGTPAYMAPEQHALQPTDARTDQFAFCVTAWELLLGTRPFAGETYIELAAAVMDGKIETPPRSAVPGRIIAALRRGLSVEPAARFPDMSALIAALQPSSTTAWWLGAVAVVGVGVAAALAWGTLRRTPEEKAADQREAQVEAALSIALPGADERQVEAALDYLERYGDSDPGLAAIAHAAIGRSLLRESCEAPRDGLCVTIEPRGTPPLLCIWALRGVLRPVPRGPELDEARTHLQAVVDAPPDALDPHDPAHAAFLVARAQAQLALADLELEAFLAHADTSPFASGVTERTRPAFERYATQRRIELDAVLARYAEIDDRVWTIAAGAREGSALLAFTDELVAVVVPPGLDFDETNAYCSAQASVYRPIQLEAHDRLVQCATLARTSGRADSYAELCDGLANAAMRADAGNFQQAVLDHNADVVKCYEDQLPEHPDARGKILLTWELPGDGHATKVALTEDTLGLPATATCLVGVIEGIQFPTHDLAQPIELSYPIEFAP